MGCKARAITRELQKSNYKGTVKKKKTKTVVLMEKEDSFVWQFSLYEYVLGIMRPNICKCLYFSLM